MRNYNICSLCAINKRARDRGGLSAGGVLTLNAETELEKSEYDSRHALNIRYIEPRNSELYIPGKITG